MTSTSPSEVVQEISALYAARGDDEYFGEKVTQSQHALQAAACARAAGADDETVIAALLHDIGHLLSAGHHADLGHIGYEQTAEPWLRERGFGERCIALIGAHVAAKRFLVATHPAYAAQLSDASRQTLELQGGPMSPEEAHEFAANPLCQEMVRLRAWDEQAKDPDAAVPGLDVYTGVIEQYLAARAGTLS
ncbi:MAG: phosphohydrolase [Bryobacteraceae bacterium]|jgi:phosphonate degradation associated HDIG domain protein